MKSYQTTNYRKVGLCLATMAMTLPVFAQDNAEDLDDDILLLSPFEVEASSNVGYLATQTLAGTRIKTDLKDVGSAISVVTKEMLRDTGATDNQTLLSYTTNTEVGGTSGNFAGFVGDSGSLDETDSLMRPNSNTRVRGLTSADNTRDYFVSEIPWDSYNTERVDMQRGPNAILFGLGSPAGIINSSTNTANFDASTGNVEVRADRWGSFRTSVDYNQIIIPGELAVRFDALYDDTKFRQQQAYEKDKRMYAALRYAPSFLNNDNVTTQLRVNYEHGEIDANRPRTLTPTDTITAWWDELDQAGYNTEEVNADYGELDTDGGNYEGWISGVFADAYGGIVLSHENGSTSYSSAAALIYDTNGLKADGSTDGTIEGIPFMREPAIATTSNYASNTGLPGYDIGAYKNVTLSDDTIFDFYNNLLDGNTKKESQDWDTYNINFSQNFFGNRFGYEMVYDHQEYYEEQEAYLNSYNAAISIDIRETLLDGSTNPNFGRAYVANRLTYGNSSNDIERENFRFTTTAELRGSDFFDEDSMLAHIIGKHNFTGLYSKDKARTDSRSWTMLDAQGSWYDEAGSTSATAGDTSLYVVTYLSDSLADVDSYEGLYLSPLTSLELPTSSTVTYFDSTWTATDVSPGAWWDANGDGEIAYDYDDDGNITGISSGETQAENPDNYAGWTTDTFDYESDRDKLYTAATLDRTEVESKAFIWQAYLFDGLVVPTFGYREDELNVWTFEGASQSSLALNSNKTVDVNSIYYTEPSDATYSYKGNSKSWSVMIHTPEFIKKHLPFGLELSAFYNTSKNFQPVGARTDVLGNDITPPEGDTKERGFLISALDNRVNFKINWYETTVTNASMSGGLGALSDTVYYIGAVEAWGGYAARRYANGESLVLADWAYDWSAGYYNEFAVYNDDGSVNEEASIAATAAAEAACLEDWFANEVDDTFKSAWNINYNSADTDPNADLATYTTPSTLAATCDMTSKGVEYELFLQPTDNWSITLNASKTSARRYNLGASLEDWILYRDEVFDGAAGDLRLWWAGDTTLVRDEWNRLIMSNYQLFKQLENADSPELRPWRANIITNYYFSEGPLKGFSIGGGYRWQDKSIIGYYIADYDGDGNWSYDLDSPYYGKSTSAFDLWIGYGCSLTDKVDWRIQLNVRNVFGKKELIPLNVTPTADDPTQLEVASWAIAEGMNFTITNTFSF
jgi:hypothetical protein